MVHEKMKNLIYFFAGMVFMIMIGLATAADASGSDIYIDNSVTYNYDETFDGATAPPSSSGDDDFDMAMAMSAAGDVCVFDYASGWQGCGGAGFFGDAQAYNGSLVTRVDQFMIRFNLQADEDFSEYAAAIGGSWHF